MTMTDFSSYGNEFSNRYDKAVMAASEQRKRQQEPGDVFATEAAAGINGDVNGISAPQEFRAQTTDEQFDPGVDMTAEKTKNYLLSKARERMSAVVAPED